LRTGAKTFYIFDGDTLLGEVQNTSGFPTTAAYTWGANGLVSERLIGSSKSLWYHFGPQGETRLLTNSTGAVADTYTYYAYGGVKASSGTDINAFKYGGQYGYYNHPAAPLSGYLCGQRWYASGYGTFYTRDPIGYEGGDNLYQYCDSNPLSFVDPLGLNSKGNYRQTEYDKQKWLDDIKEKKIEKNSGGKTLEQRNELQAEIDKLQGEIDTQEKVAKNRGSRANKEQKSPKGTKGGRSVKCVPKVYRDPVNEAISSFSNADYVIFWATIEAMVLTRRPMGATSAVRAGQVLRGIAQLSF
jgi:RHS repeat-associated protein